MIKTQIIKEDNKPVAVIMDYRKYIALKEAAEDKKDYDDAIETKLKNKKWTNHEDLKKKLGM
jgi:translation initiation factor IF-3